MRALLVLIIGAILLSVAIPGRVPDRHPWAHAREVARGHYVVKTNTFPELANSLGTRLNEAYALYEDRFGPLTAKGRMPMRVLLFRTRQGYLRHGDGVAGAVGHFDSALDRCSLIWRGHIGERGWPVAVHEGCHHYFRRRFPTIHPPSWYSEGVACWFEGLYDDSTDRKVARLRIRSARAALEAGEASLEKVLRARAQVEGGTLTLTRFAPARFYGLAWSLVHFLATDPEMKQGFRRFEMRLFVSHPLPSQREINARRLLEEECGNLKVLERRWHEHLRGLPLPAVPRQPPVYVWELASDRAYVRYAALQRLSSGITDLDLRAAVVTCQEDADLVVRDAACRVLARDMGLDAVPGMLKALDIGDEALKLTAIQALALKGANQAVPRLLRERDYREHVLKTLATIGDPRAFEKLRAAVLDPALSSRTRSLCVAALERDPKSGDTLEKAARDGDIAVRNAARMAQVRTERLRQKADELDTSIEVNVDRLLSVAMDKSGTDRARKLACSLLGTAKARGAVPSLQLLCGTDSPDPVRLAAIRALVRITGETRGFAAGQRLREREAAYRAWYSDE